MLQVVKEKREAYQKKLRGRKEQPESYVDDGMRLCNFI